eukprot:scaffold92841_cov23-Cyclotella_meneghiniana.AAC.1
MMFCTRRCCPIRHQRVYSNTLVVLKWRAHYSKWLYVIEAARPGLDSEVLFVYVLKSGKRVGTHEGIVVRAGVTLTTPESGRLSTSYGLVDTWCWRNTPLSIRFEF